MAAPVPPAPTPATPPPRVLAAAGAYFGLVFAAGFACGAVRVPLLVPRLGERAAELLEMPMLLLAIVAAARFVDRRFALPPAVLPRLGVGGLALACLLAVETTVVLQVRGLTLAEYVRARDPVAGAAYVAMLAVFALLPAWRCRGVVPT